MKTTQTVIAVAGNAAVDMTLREIDPEWLANDALDMYTPEMIYNLKVPPYLTLGGNAAGAAYVLGKFGLRVLLNAPIGDDVMGDLVRSWLKKANVRCIESPRESTVVGITAVDARGKRLGTLQHPGPRVHWKLSAESSAATWLLVAVHSQVVIAELKEVGSTLRRFQTEGRTTVLDSGIGWLRHAKPKQLFDLWSHADLLIGTLDELAHWTGCNSPKSIARFTLARGPKQVIIKMGAKGAACCERDGAFSHQSARAVRRMDLSIGAGDAFDGAVIAELVAGKSLVAAVNSAQAVASQVVETGRGVIGWDESSNGKK